jgi:hypothetical protein
VKRGNPPPAARRQERGCINLSMLSCRHIVHRTPAASEGVGHRPVLRLLSAVCLLHAAAGHGAFFLHPARPQTIFSGLLCFLFRIIFYMTSWYTSPGKE